MYVNTKQRWLAALVSLCLVMTATMSAAFADGIPAPAANDGSQSALHLYIAPNGDDSADGLSQATALQSITGANALLAGSPVDEDVVIHFAAGEYQIAKGFYWNYAMPGRTISFEGAGEDQTVFSGAAGSDITFLTVNSCGSTSFSFQNFTIRNMRNGIIMRVSNDGSALTQDGVTGYFGNLTFTELGGYYTRNSTPGVAAIQFLGSCNNNVENCNFLKIRDYAGLNIHGLYISTFSSNNVVRSCNFEDIQPDPVRLRRGSSNNRIENCSFVNSGTYAYCSEWEAGPAEPETCTGVVFSGNELFGGYAGAPIPAIKIFIPGTDQPDAADANRLNEYDNILHDSVLDPTVPAAVKNFTATVDGVACPGTVPVYSIDRYEPYLNIDDLALLLKNTQYGFTYAVSQESIVLTLSQDYAGTSFSVQPDAVEGDITAEKLLQCSIQYDGKSNGSAPVFEKEGAYFVSLNAVRELMEFKLTVAETELRFVTKSQSVEVPEKIEVLMMKFPGSFANKDENKGNYPLTNPENYDVVVMDTSDLSGKIKFEELIRDQIRYVVVGIPIGSGTFGIREWKNETIKDYYTFADRKWSTASGGYADSFHVGDDEFIYYAIVPVGGGKPGQYPQFRVAPNWTSGSLPAYTQFLITDIENYVLPDPVSYDALNEALQAAEELDSSRYTAASWGVLEIEMNKAVGMLKALQADQDEIDTAAAALKTAMDALVERGDGSALRDAVEQAKRLKPTDYTADSASRLTNAIAAAERLLADADAEQSAIDAALKDLRDAVGGLQPESEPQPEPDGDHRPVDTPQTGGVSDADVFVLMLAGSACCFLALLVKKKLNLRRARVQK